MAAKDYSFISSKNHNLSFNQDSTNGLYHNLNLNNTFNHSSKDIAVISKSSVIHNNCYQLPTNDHVNQQSNRSSDFKDFSKFPRPIFDIKDRGKKDYSKQSNVGSSSTLMLHINAAEQNDCSQNLESVNNISTDNHQLKKMKKWKSPKEFLKSSKSVEHAFEFPRQQENEAHTTPEVMQFKTSQRMANVNPRWLGELGITRKKKWHILYYEIDGQICHVFLLDTRSKVSATEDAEKKFYCRTCESIDRKRRIWKVVNGVQFIDDPALNHHEKCNGIPITEKRREQLINSFDKKIEDAEITANNAEELFQQYQEHMGSSMDQNLTDNQKKSLKNRLFRKYSDSQSSKALTNDVVENIGQITLEDGEEDPTSIRGEEEAGTIFSHINGQDKPEIYNAKELDHERSVKNEKENAELQNSDKKMDGQRQEPRQQPPSVDHSGTDNRQQKISIGDVSGGNITIN